MIRPLLGDAFAHHVWATLRLIDACAALTGDQLATTIPGTYGSIIGSLRHLVAADSGYLQVLSGGGMRITEQDAGDLAELRTAMEAHADRWQALLERDLDPDTVVIRHREDGSETHAPVGIRFAQALHHGSDHRSQICTILTSLDIEPPGIDVWDFAWDTGRLTEVPPSS